MKKPSWLKSIVCILCIAMLLPTITALAANEGAEAPKLTLICPQPADSAALADQKFIWQSTLPVSAQADKLISVQEKDADPATVYSIAANNGAVAISGGNAGPWLITLAMNSLTAGDATAFSAVAGKTYTVSVAEGAFISSGGTPSVADAVSFTLSASEEALSLITYALPGGWKVESVANDESGTRATISCGAAVPDGTILTVSGAAPAGNRAFGSVATPANTAPEAQAINDKLDLTVAGNTHIVVTFREATLSGAASIVSTAANSPENYVPAYGDTIKGVYTGSDVGTDTSHLIYTFLRGETQLQSGASDTYVIQADDINSAITLVITSSTYTGSAKVDSEVVRKQTVAAPAAPTILSNTNSAVTLNTVTGCEYSMDGTTFRSDTTFAGLAPGQSYTFYQRYVETATAFASQNSTGLTTQLGQAELTGTVVIDGTQRAGQKLTAKLTDSNNTGTLAFNWFREGSFLGSGDSYTAATADIDKILTVEVTSSVQSGKRTASTGKIGKMPAGAPSAPTLASSTNNSVTLNAVAGCEYSMDNSNWQDSTTFGNLASGQTYTFYQRLKATNMLEASAPSSASFATAATQNSLTGNVVISGDVRYGKTLVATLTNANSTGAPSYTWYRGATAVGTGTTYDVSNGDIGYPLYVQVVCAGTSGSITKLAGTVQRAEYIGIAPTAPTRESRSTSRVTLTPHAGYEYSRDGKTWQSSNVFSGLSAGKTYTFYQRIAATASTDASPASDAFRTATSSSSSSSGSSSGSNSSSGGSSSVSTPAPDDDKPSGSGALYTYATTGESTRILFSTMERLVAGNKTQDVTITSGNIQFRFFKGTMQLSEGTLWYDFGTELNGAELLAAARAIAGDSVVAAVHFNHSGELPAKANIRIALDGSQAGKALYYYRLENGALTYIQTAIADISGAVTVVQSSCSDYVLLDRDFFAEEPTPSPTPEASASPTPLAADNAGSGNSSNSGGWFIVLIIIAALLLIVIGILFYLKSRQANSFDTSFHDFDEYPDDDPDDDPDGGDFLGDDYEEGYDDYHEEPLADPYGDEYDSGSRSQALYGEAPSQQPYAPTRPTTYQPEATYAPPSPEPVQESAPYRAPETAAQDDANAVADSPADGMRTANAGQHHTPDVPGKYPRARYRP